MTEDKSDDSPDDSPIAAIIKRVTAPGWGPKLFLGILVLILVFFWWLLIWTGGVDPHHG